MTLSQSKVIKMFFYKWFFYRGLTKEARGIEKTIFVDMTWHEADYGLVSTVSDLVKYGNIFASCLLVINIFFYFCNLSIESF